MTTPQDFFALFDQVRIIHLADRSDRQRDMEAEFRRLGVAIDGRHIAFCPGIRPESAESFPTRGAHGCFLSHLSLLRRAWADGARRVLILEDDLNFVRDFSRQVGAVLAAKPQIEAAGLAYFGYEWPDAASALHGLPPGLTTLQPAQPLLCAHFMSVSAPALAALVPYLEAMLTRTAGDPAGGPMHVDGAYHWFRRSHPQIGTVIWTPRLGHQRASRTDIHETPWFETLPGAWALLQPLRALKNRLRRG